MRVERVDRLIKALRKLALKNLGQSSVSVGYRASYALYVHENLEMKWRGLPRDRSSRPDLKNPGVILSGYKPLSGKHGLFWGPQGQAKFLEGPARQYAGDMAAMIQRGVASGKKVIDAVLIAALWLQGVSQRLVPVDSGNLRASAFTQKD